jgi:hypothetical protein
MIWAINAGSWMVIPMGSQITVDVPERDCLYAQIRKQQQNAGFKQE